MAPAPSVDQFSAMSSMWTWPLFSMSNKVKSCFMAVMKVSGKPSRIFRLDSPALCELLELLALVLQLSNAGLESMLDNGLSSGVVDLNPNPFPPPTGVTLLCPLIEAGATATCLDLSPAAAALSLLLFHI